MCLSVWQTISKPTYDCNLAKLLYFFQNMFFKAHVVMSASMCIRSHLCYTIKPRVTVLTGGHGFRNVCVACNKEKTVGYQENIVKITHNNILPFKRYFIRKVFVIQFMAPMFCPWLYLWYNLILSHMLSVHITWLGNIVFRKNKHLFYQLHVNMCYYIDCVGMVYQNIQTRICSTWYTLNNITMLSYIYHICKPTIHNCILTIYNVFRGK